MAVLLFYKNYNVCNVMYMLSYSPSFVCLHLLVSEILPEVVYCCFTRTTLFTTMFTVIIVVRSLKSLCIPSSS